MTTNTLTHTAGTDELQAIAFLVAQIRGEWPAAVTMSVLQAHAGQCDAGDLAVAALRAAMNPEYRTPKTIGWRGPHWDGSKTKPNQVQLRRCNTCGKREDRCAMERPGLDDDHDFEPSLERPRLERAR